MTVAVTELPGVLSGSSRRDRMRCVAISQRMRDAVRSSAPFLCYGKKGVIWAEPRARNIMEGCCPK
eukprot:7160571-Lingulodinium_polyedra.AAC.1